MIQFDALTKVVVESFVEKQILTQPFIPGVFYFQAGIFATDSPYHLTGSVSETTPEITCTGDINKCNDQPFLML
ncbi:hypothetical protein MNBD_GAMMA18-2117 [hydrothermal vent metagenome]|uniref:Uncharacterized protein n=1 Tax=hydrothermal vent metagenome TaxID=652676 RepID=A0A3B0ZGP6_9ZZZZ